MSTPLTIPPDGLLTDASVVDRIVDILRDGIVAETQRVDERANALSDGVEEADFWTRPEPEDVVGFVETNDASPVRIVVIPETITTPREFSQSGRGTWEAMRDDDFGISIIASVESTGYSKTDRRPQGLTGAYRRAARLIAAARAMLIRAPELQRYDDEGTMTHDGIAMWLSLDATERLDAETVEDEPSTSVRIRQPITVRVRRIA